MRRVSDWIVLLLALLLLATSVAITIQTHRIERLEKLIDQQNKQVKKYRLMSAIIDCESGGKHDVYGGLGKEHPAYGIAQFQERTFYWFAAKMGFEGQWTSRRDQLKVLSWALDNGYGNHWDCYKKIQKKEF